MYQIYSARMNRFLIKRTLVTSQVFKAKKGSGDSKTATKKRNKYSDTVLLPQTQFRAQINGKERIEKDEYLTKTCGFPELYQWQRNNLPGPDFVLHDGPPYANGVPHMGHAINKILKDVTLRHKILNGNKVHYTPGWDCHGLPVELKAIDNDKSLRDPLEIRKRARKCAMEAVAKQKQAFQSWGITADWNEAGCYFTNQPLYMKNQLNQFIKLYEKGIIFRDFMPVYWSPSSRTALAESELEYNEHHKSKATTVRLRLDNIPERLSSYKDRSVYGLIWTTTPWSLVANQALAFSTAATYCLAEDTKRDLYIIAKELLQSIESKIGPLKPIEYFEGRELKDSTYFHPITKEKCPFLAARHVTTNVGTGLVHTAPAHGPEDFLVALENKMRILIVVDADGRYTEAAGQKFHGLKVQTHGVTKVIETVGPDILHIEVITHSYPYDWRTKEPVILLASNQWFIDINSIREKVIDSIANVEIYPKCNRTSSKNALLSGVQSRPYWCISRQRSWGTPIPVLYSKTTGKVFTNKEVVDRLCNSIDKFGPDCWWEYSVDELIGTDVIERLNVPVDDVEKGEDIMDIWFDSGISWSFATPNGEANLYLEGYDQFSGWFQSSLITSVALKERSPYNALFVHGFAVDENNMKMSKSLGNVINPDELLLGGSNLQKNPVYGVDVLRWWVANHGSQHRKVPVSKDLLEGCKQCIHKIRLILRFLLGVSKSHRQDASSNLQYRVIDKYMLHSLYRYNKQVQQHYNDYEYHHAGKAILNFITNDVSALYCTMIKDRLYCDEALSPARIAAVQVIKEILNVLLRSIAPIVPHLAEEAWLHYTEDQAMPLHCTEYKIPSSWNDPTIVEYVDAALSLRSSILKTTDKNTWKMHGVIEATNKDFRSLSLLYDREQPALSELCEILQLSSVTLTESDTITETRIQVHEIEKPACERCRRYPETREDGLCSRCASVLAKDKSMTAIM